MLARGLGRKKALGSCNMEWFCLVASVWRRSPLFSGLFSERPAVSAALPSRSAAVFRRRSSLFSVGLSHTGEAFFPLRSQKNLLLTSLSHSLSPVCYRLDNPSCCELSSICTTVRASSTRFSAEWRNQHGQFATFSERFGRLYKRREWGIVSFFSSRCLPQCVHADPPLGVTCRFSEALIGRGSCQ